MQQEPPSPTDPFKSILRLTLAVKREQWGILTQHMQCPGSGSQSWSLMPVISALGILRQEYWHQGMASLDYRVIPLG